MFHQTFQISYHHRSMISSNTCGCVCTSVDVSVHVHKPVHTEGKGQSMLSIFFRCFLSYYFILPLSLEFTISTRLSRSSFSLIFPRPGVTDLYHHSWASLGNWGSKLRSSYLCSKSVSPCTHLSSP